jgi:signal peptide peptidase SppA
MKYESIIRAFCNTPWLIDERKYQEILEFLTIKANGGTIEYEAAASRPTKNVKGDVAVIPIIGTISHRASMLGKSSGGTSAMEIGQMFDSVASDPGVGAIVLDIDSPGGAVSGTPELADKIYKARTDGKKIIAVANTMAASGAFWLYSQASEKVIPPSGEVGSLGVLVRHADLSQADAADGIKTTLIKSAKYKAETNPYEPLSDDARANLQEQVNRIHDTFVDAVARGFGLSASKVDSGFGQGRVFGAKEAKDRGMADRIDTLEGVLLRLTGTKAAADLSRRRMAV